MTFSVIIPAYNEAEVLAETYSRVTAVMKSMNEPYEIYFVNDGSTDGTAEIIAGFCNADRAVKMISFTRNFGHMSAISAGMEYARGQAIFIIDADLQDPPEVFPRMVEKWRQGFHVVYGKRRTRSGDGFIKKQTAKLFYRAINAMATVELPLDTGEFRMIDRAVCDAVNKLPEKSRYIRGLVSWVGFKQTAVEYDRNPRAAGKTKYPLQKMMIFAVDAITAFSYKPLRLATGLGFVISIISFGYMLQILYQHFFTDRTISGWSSTMVAMLLTQGIVLIILGIMGEYIARIYQELKGRPVYIIQEILGGELDDLM